MGTLMYYDQLIPKYFISIRISVSTVTTGSISLLFSIVTPVPRIASLIISTQQLLLLKWTNQWNNVKLNLKYTHTENLFISTLVRKGDDEEFFGEVWNGVWKFSKTWISLESQELGKPLQEEGQSEERPDHRNWLEDKVGAGA